MANPWFYQNDSYNYHLMPYPYNRMEDTTERLSSLIDPSLQSFTSPSAHPTTMDQHQSMQFQLKEEQKTMFFNSDIPQQTTFMPSTIGVMSPFQVRCISPFSAFETSEASGSAQSPPADTNTEPPAYYETRSPLQEPLHLEDFGFPQNHQFAGIGQGPGSFVNPMDVNSTGQLDGYDSEASTLEFTLPQPVNTWEGYTTGGVSGCDMEQMQQQQQHSSPIVDCTKPVNHYPPASQEKIEEQSPAILPLAPNLKRTRHADVDDDEYLPTIKRTAAVLGRSTSTKTKTTAPRRGRPPTSHFPFTTHRPHQNQNQHQPTRTLLSTATKALTPNASRGNFLCPHPPCQQSSHGFKDQTSLDAHIKKQHARPLICVFSFAGCDSTFGSKNEWKRHVASQHLVLEYWLCREGECANVDNSAPSSSSVAVVAGTSALRLGRRRRTKGSVQIMVTGDNNNNNNNNNDDNDDSEDDDDEEEQLPLLPNGAIFNRKDLYTQHVRRMHLPSHLIPYLRKESTSTSSSSSSKSSSLALTQTTNDTTQQELNAYIATLQSRAQIKRCSLPTYMRCPVPSCQQAPFTGTEAWDQRMEHVAKHLESYAATTASGTRTGSEVDCSSSSSSSSSEAEQQDKVEFGGENDKTLTEWASSCEVGIIKRVKAGTERAEGWKWVTRDPIKRRGHGGIGSANGCSVGRGGRTKMVKVKAKAKREQEEEIYVKEEIVVQTKTHHQTFEFEEDEDLEVFGDE